MKLSDSLSGRVRQARGSAVCVGTFDGVHLGHRSLLRAHEEGGRRAVARVRGDHVSPTAPQRDSPRSPRFATCVHSRSALELLEGVGLDVVAPVDFDDSVRRLTASEFIQTLIEAFGLKVLVIGPGARQGHDRLGNAELMAMGRQNGFEVVEATPAKVGDEFVSSSSIRKCVESGQVEKAAALLGRDFSLTGPVTHENTGARSLGTRPPMWR